MDKDEIDTTGLSDEEKAALGEDIDDKNVLDEIIDDEDEDGDDDDDGDDEVATEKPAKANKTTEAVADQDDDEDDGEGQEFLPLMQSKKVENYEEKISDINDKLTTLDSQLEEGDIDLKQYTSQVRLLNSEETDLKMAKLASDTAEENNLHMATQKWQWTQEQFFDDEGNKIYNENNILRSALNTAVKDLAAKAENGNKNGAWFLKEADREVRRLFGTAKKLEVVKDRKPNLSDIPKTLGNLPAAENSETADNEFGYLDKLEGMDYEAALAKLAKDPEKEARYLKSA